MSKWIAATPQNREKHFWVTRLYRDEDQAIAACELEAVVNRRQIKLDWRPLQDSSVRLTGGR